MRYDLLRGLMASLLLGVVASAPTTVRADDSSGTTLKQEDETSDDKEAETSKDEKDDDKKDEKEKDQEGGWGDAESDMRNEASRRSEQSGKSWSVAASIASRIGQGTFASLENDTGVSPEFQPLGAAFDGVSLSYELSGSYTLDTFTFSGSVSWTQGVSPGVGRDEPRQFWFNDTSLGINWKGYTIDPISTKVSASMGFSLPTGLTSQNTTKVIGTDLGVSLTRRFFDRLTLRYSLGGSKTFHRSKVPVIDIDEVGEQNYLHEQDLDGGLAAISGVNTEWGFSTSLAMSVKIWQKLTASISYGYNRSWTYHRDTDDQFQSQFADNGRGVQDLTRTGISLSYPFYEYFRVSGGLYSRQLPKTADQRSMQFPFWNFSGAAAGGSGFSLSLSGSY